MTSDWQNDAACRDANTDLFFDPAYETIAKQACADCTVSTDCLTDALARDERHGIMGGLTADERRTLGLQTTGRAA